MSSLNILDLIIAVIVLTSVVGGIRAGFARSGIGMACAVVGVLCGLWFYDIPSVWVHRWVESEMLCNVLGFLIVFFPFVIAGGFVGRAVMRLFQATGLGWMDRALGAVFGFIRGAFAAAALVTVLVAFVPKPVPDWMTNSSMLPYAISTSDVLAGLAPPQLKDALQNGIGDMRQAWVQKLHQGREELQVLESAKEVLAPEEHPRQKGDHPRQKSDQAQQKSGKR